MPRADQVSVYDVCRPMCRDLERLLCQLLTAYIIEKIRAAAACLSDRLGLGHWASNIHSALKAAQLVCVTSGPVTIESASCTNMRIFGMSELFCLARTSCPIDMMTECDEDDWRLLT